MKRIEQLAQEARISRLKAFVELLGNTVKAHETVYGRDLSYEQGYIAGFRAARAAALAEIRPYNDALEIQHMLETLGEEEVPDSG